jgi:hypothetical protein
LVQRSLSVLESAEANPDLEVFRRAVPLSIFRIGSSAHKLHASSEPTKRCLLHPNPKIQLPSTTSPATPKCDRSIGSPPVPRAAPLLRFRPLPRRAHCESFSRSEDAIAHFLRTGDKLTEPITFPPPEFLTLLTCFSSQRVVGLFRPTDTQGFTLQSLPLFSSRCHLSMTRALLSLQTPM